ncbi:hypothetical protein E4V01_21840 [Methylorubrum sp. Q1]|uniref:hypothetical protein n=1 Tax=Methylorubrum sp. Q1 TaxID=2562453 RepID=UPI0010762B05|nr:hypothetical protein [Methylorubrum sp. Q1]TFZ55567.1 hypothetical protein E4V01_21840 [Methylorubrum sp. Q1]
MSKPIHLLRRGQCRFAVTPHSAPSHLFCAEPVEHEKSSYCAHHAEICFDRRSAEQRRADAERAAIAREAMRKPKDATYGPLLLSRLGIDTVSEDAA